MTSFCKTIFKFHYMIPVFSLKKSQWCKPAVLQSLLHHNKWIDILIQGPWANGQVLSTQMQLLNMSFRLHSFCSTNKFFTNANNFIMQSIHSNTAANAFSYLQREQVHPYPKQQEEDPKLRCHYFRLWFHGTMSQSRVYACSLKKKKIAWSINLYFIYH